MGVPNQEVEVRADRMALRRIRRQLRKENAFVHLLRVVSSVSNEATTIADPIRMVRKRMIVADLIPRVPGGFRHAAEHTRGLVDSEPTRTLNEYKPGLLDVPEARHLLALHERPD